MKFLFKEYTTEYKEYAYPYKVYAKKEEGDDINEIYNKGFLATRLEKDLFYLSRNLRLNLNEFELNSENRRILKKTDDLEIENKKLNEFEYDYEIGKIAIDFFKEKFQDKIISAQKLKWLFQGEFFTNVLIFKKQKEIIGYCITMETDELIHYAYPFYRKEYINSNLGMGMMLKTILHGKEKQKKYIYLGTVYTKDSLYKLQFKGLEWFDGEKWENDINLLKEKIT